MIDLARIETEVVELTEHVADFIRTECKQFNKADIEQKGSSSNLVSYVDKQAEAMLVETLSKLLPGCGFLGEEGTSSEGSNGYRWIIDPLDGTTNFTHGFPLFAISVGLAKDDQMVLGVIYEVTSRECFHSSLHRPAFLNGKEMHVSKVSQLNEALLATGFPYYHLDKMEQYLDIIKEFLYQTHGIRRLGSAATDLAYVACGRLEGFFEYNLNPWDVAAGAFLVQQAGGTVTDFSGGSNFVFGGELCAGCAVHPQMLQLIQRLWK